MAKAYESVVNEEPGGAHAEVSPDRLAYEAPSLVAVGNVREMLAQVVGMYPDAEPGAEGQDN